MPRRRSARRGAGKRPSSREAGWRRRSRERGREPNLPRGRKPQRRAVPKAVNRMTTPNQAATQFDNRRGYIYEPPMPWHTSPPDDGHSTSTTRTEPRVASCNKTRRRQTTARLLRDPWARRSRPSAPHPRSSTSGSPSQAAPARASSSTESSSGRMARSARSSRGQRGREECDLLGAPAETRIAVGQPKPCRAARSRPRAAAGREPRRVLAQIDVEEVPDGAGAGVRPCSSSVRAQLGRARRLSAQRRAISAASPMLASAATCAVVQTSNGRAPSPSRRGARGPDRVADAEASQAVDLREASAGRRRSGRASAYSATASG